MSNLIEVGLATTKSKSATTTMAAAKRTRLEADLKCEEDKGGGGGGGGTSSKPTTTKEITIVTNSFFNEFFDCMQNLPNRLQVLFSELSNVDAQVKRRHRTLQLIKHELTKRTSGISSISMEIQDPEESKYNTSPLDELLRDLHRTLLECQNLGDQKVRIASQIIETICAKTRQLGLDCKSSNNDERKFDFELNEATILAQFKQAVRKTRPLSSFFTNNNPQANTPSSDCAANTRTSSRHTINNKLSKSLIDNKPSKSSPIHDAYEFGDGGQTNLNGHKRSKVYDSPSPVVNGKRSAKKFKCDSEIESSEAARPNARPKRQLNYSPNKQASSQSLVAAVLSSSSSSSSSMNQNQNQQAHKRRLVAGQCRSPSSLSTASTCSTSIKSGYMMLSRASKIHQMKKKSTDSKIVAQKRLRSSPRPSTTALLGANKKNKLVNGNAKSTGEDDDDDEDEDDDVSLSADEIELDGIDRLERINDGDDDSKSSVNDHSSSSPGSSSGTCENKLDDAESDVEMTPDDEIKAPNSSSNETESIKQLDDDENEFAATTTTTSNSTIKESRVSVKNSSKDNDRLNCHNKPEPTDPETSATATSTTTNNNSTTNSDNHHQHHNHHHNHQNPNEKKKSSLTSASSRLKSTNSNSDISNSTATTTTTTSGTPGPSTSNHRQLNEDEPVYCLCREISYGQMILCDNDACKIEWFHFQCVKLTSKPKGKWYCPQCRGETHRVMKKQHNTTATTTTTSSSSSASPSYYSNYYSTRNK